MSIRFKLFVILLFTAMMTQAEELMRLDLDESSLASPRIMADRQVKVEGDSSLKIETRWPTTVFLAEVPGPDVENALLTYSARVKTDLDQQGTAYLELWVHLNGGRFFSRGMDDVVGQVSDWKTIRTSFMLKQGQRPDKVTLNLVINGKGTVWIDDAVLSRETLR